jgi:hypothetical protein
MKQRKKSIMTCFYLQMKLSFFFLYLFCRLLLRTLRMLIVEATPRMKLKKNLCHAKLLLLQTLPGIFIQLTKAFYWIYIFFLSNFRKKVIQSRRLKRVFIFKKKQVPLHNLQLFWWLLKLSELNVDLMAFCKSKEIMKSWIFHLNSCWSFFTWIREDFSPDFVFYFRNQREIVHF